MKHLLVLVLTLVMAGSALAVVDTTDNNLGIYFDTNSDVYSGTLPLYTPTSVYLNLTNPTFTSLYGYEVQISMTGVVPVVMGAAFSNPQALNVGTSTNQIVGFGTPTVVTESTVLCTLTLLVTAAGPTYFSLGPSVPSSNTLGLPSILADSVGNVATTGYTNYDGVNCAAANDAGFGVVGTEKASFDSVKSLYR